MKLLYLSLHCWLFKQQKCSAPVCHFGVYPLVQLEIPQLIFHFYAYLPVFTFILRLSCQSLLWFVLVLSCLASCSSWDSLANLSLWFVLGLFQSGLMLTISLLICFHPVHSGFTLILWLSLNLVNQISRCCSVLAKMFPSASSVVSVVLSPHLYSLDLSPCVFHPFQLQSPLLVELTLFPFYVEVLVLSQLETMFDI